jgi:hypothetical protein
MDSHDLLRDALDTAARELPAQDWEKLLAQLRAWFTPEEVAVLLPDHLARSRSAVPSAKASATDAAF